MKSKTQRADEISHLQEVYKYKKDAIGKRLEEFKNISSSEYFYELAYCLLTPQSSAAHAASVIEELKKRGFQKNPFNTENILRRKNHYIRFHKTKALRLLLLHSKYNEIAARLEKEKNPRLLRDYLTKHVLGIGYKEAAHFLRNIGKNDGLAILDRHILRYLVKLKVIRSIPKSLSAKKYIQIEKKFQNFAAAIGISLDELDLLFWSESTGEIRK